MRRSAKVDEAELAIIAEDRTCRRCGYNLRGLKLAGVCPECGAKIAKKAPKIPRFKDQMIEAPLKWLTRFMHAAFLMLLGGPVTGAAYLIAGLAESVIAWSIAAGASVVWCVGVVMATGPRPAMAGIVEAPEVEWLYRRTAARLMQGFWVLGAVIGLVLSVGSRAGMGAFGLGAVIGCALVGVAGFGPLYLHLMNLAHWASDTELAQKFRVLTWYAPLGGLAVMGFSLVARVGAVGGLMGVLLTAAALTGLVIMPLGMQFFAQWNLWRTARWAVMNHITLKARDERLMQRARRAAEQAARTAADPAAGSTVGR